MPLVLLLIGGLVRAVGPLVTQILLSLGISFIAYSGIDFALEAAKTRAFSALSGNGALFMQFMGVFQIGTAINIIASAMIARTVLMGITGGKLTKMITKS
jgi:hypothetical protein